MNSGEESQPQKATENQKIMKKCPKLRIFFATLGKQLHVAPLPVRVVLSGARSNGTNCSLPRSGKQGQANPGENDISQFRLKILICAELW